MNVIARTTPLAYAGKHPETAQGLAHWYGVTKRARWQSMADVMAAFPKAKALNGERVRFGIAGGNYRLIVAFKFTAQIAWVKFIGTHGAYDRIDALTVDQF